VAGLGLFSSTKGEGLRTLNDYAADMPMGQKEIYVLLAADRESAQRSPHLEAFRAKGFEVLLLTDPVDEFVLQRLTTFQDKTIRRIDQGEIDLSDDADSGENEAKEKELEPMIEAVRKELSERVEEVRFSKRLTDSPACLVAGENALPQHLVRLMREQGQDVPDPKHVLELNPKHPLIESMGRQVGDDFGRFSNSCELLFGLAQLAEGSTLSDPGKFSRLVSEMMLE
jgi:molecular chaperone HtpG